MIKDHDTEQEDLLAYYFGTISDERRILIEERLLSSQSLLMEYIALKRTLEVSIPSDLIPSLGAKKRLQDSIAQIFPNKKFGLQKWVVSLCSMKSARLQWTYPGTIATGAALLILLGGGFLFKSILSERVAPSTDGIPNRQERLIDSADGASARDHYL